MKIRNFLKEDKLSEIPFPNTPKIWKVSLKKINLDLPQMLFEYTHELEIPRCYIMPEGHCRFLKVGIINRILWDVLHKRFLDTRQSDL